MIHSCARHVCLEIVDFDRYEACLVKADICFIPIKVYYFGCLLDDALICLLVCLPSTPLRMLAHDSVRFTQPPPHSGHDLAQLRTLPALAQLRISGMRLPSESELSLVCSAASGAGLTVIDLGLCDGVGDVLAATLGKCKALMDLTVHAARHLTDAGLSV